jgi:hypothetical protein
MKQEKPTRELYTDIMFGMLTLQRMNDCLQERENYSESLIADAYKSIQNLAEWRIQDEEKKSYVNEMLHLLNHHLDLNKELKRQKDELWKKHVSRVGQKSL